MLDVKQRRVKYCDVRIAAPETFLDYLALVLNEKCKIIEAKKEFNPTFGPRIIGRFTIYIGNGDD